MSKLVITDIFNPHGIAESGVLSIRRLSRDDAEQLVTGALYGLPDQRTEVLAHVYDGVIADALNSCRSFGIEFRPRGFATVPDLGGGDAVLFVALAGGGMKFDGFRGVSPTYLANVTPRDPYSNSAALAKRLDGLLADARECLVFMLVEVECEVSVGEQAAVRIADDVTESTHDSPH